MTDTAFTDACATAIAEGHAARREAVDELARRIIAGDPGLDPAALDRLGPSGLGDLLSAIRKGGVLLPVAVEPQPRVDKPAAAPALGATDGWASQRRSEPRWALWALMEGTAWGGLVIAAGTLLLILQ